MKYVNDVTLLGNVGRDPEIRQTNKEGLIVAKFTLATNRRSENEQTDWHHITVFGKLAELVDKYVKKGDRVLVKGRIEYSQTGTEENTRYWTAIVAEDVVFGLNGGGRDA